jgi:hypothetical protein
MSESLLGRNVAVTRQNAGIVRNAAAWFPCALAGAKAPAAYDCADVIVAFGSDSDISVSHGTAAAADVAETAIEKRTRAQVPASLFVMVVSWVATGLCEVYLT